MGWKVTDAVELRYEFVLRAMAKDESMSSLCREYGISRKCGYKWVERYEAKGLRGLSDESRRPKGHALAVSAELALEVVRLRHRWPNWGQAKIRKLLLDDHSEDEVPSIRTIARIIDQADLVKRRKRRPEKSAFNVLPRVVPEAPNELTTIDFKGWWKTQDNARCEPLTIRDEYSRYIFAVQILASTSTELVQEVMVDVFKKYGLPNAIRSDNGAPFYAPGKFGITKLSAWWLRLGIALARIPPGRPDQNGGHERMHRDLKSDQQLMPAGNLKKQQVQIDQWRTEFNCIRPHEALGMKRPADVYKKSKRVYPKELPEPVYPVGFEIRQVSHKGMVKFRGRERFFSEALAGQTIGIETAEEGNLNIWFMNMNLGETDSYWNEPVRAF